MNARRRRFAGAWAWRRPARLQHSLFRASAARGGPAGRAGRGARRARGGRGGGFGDRDDFYATLHAVFVKKHEHTPLFDQAFRIFWRRKGLLEKLIAMMSPRRAGQAGPAEAAEAGASRVAGRAAQVAPAGAEGRSVARPRRPLHAVRQGNPARQRFRANERGRDRRGADADQQRSSCRRTGAAPGVSRPPHAAFASTPGAAFAARCKPGGAIDLDFRAPRRAARRRSWRSATFPAR